MDINVKWDTPKTKDQITQTETESDIDELNLKNWIYWRKYDRWGVLLWKISHHIKYNSIQWKPEYPTSVWKWSSQKGDKSARL